MQNKKQAVQNQPTGSSIGKGRRNDGRALEKAIHFLQETILQTDLGLRHGQFQVELNRIIERNGTHHEVDVYVVRHPGTERESIIFIECKDWQKPVSKNEVMILKEKVHLLGAALGILVARSVTKDAQALIAHYNCIQFRQFDNDLKGILVSVAHVRHDQISATVAAIPRDPRQAMPALAKTTLCTWNGRRATLQAFAQEWADAVAMRGPGPSPGPYGLAGAHWFPARERRQFAPGEFTLEGHDIAALEIQAAFMVTITEGSLLFTYSVSATGQVQSFQIRPTGAPDQRIEVNLVLAGPPPPDAFALPSAAVPKPTSQSLPPDTQLRAYP